MSTVTERKGTIGTTKGTGESELFTSKANFSLKIVAKVEGTKDGYTLLVLLEPLTMQPGNYEYTKTKSRVCVVLHQLGIHFFYFQGLLLLCIKCNAQN